MLTLMAVQCAVTMQTSIMFQYFLTRLVAAYCVFEFIAHGSSSYELLSLSISFFAVL